MEKRLGILTMKIEEKLLNQDKLFDTETLDTTFRIGIPC
jgi:hypothetical protein